MDEPTSVLDLHRQIDVLGFVAGLAARTGMIALIALQRSQSCAPLLYQHDRHGRWRNGLEWRDGGRDYSGDAAEYLPCRRPNRILLARATDGYRRWCSLTMSRK